MFNTVMIGVAIVFVVPALFSSQDVILALIWSGVAAAFPLSLLGLILINIKGTQATRLGVVLENVERYRNHLTKKLEAETGVAEKKASAQETQGPQTEEVAKELKAHLQRIEYFPEQVRRKYKIERYRGSFWFVAVVYTFLFFFAFNKILALSNFDTLQTTLTAFPDLAIAGLVGAWAFALYSVISRISAADLSPEFLLRLGYQPVIAISLAFFATFIFEAEFRLFLSFAVGFLPYPEIVKGLRNFARRHFRQVSEGTPTASTIVDDTDELLEIDGINTDEMDRLQEEKVCNIQQLAFSNPLELHFSTAYPLKTILDWTDQALLRLYLNRQQHQLLKPIGVRGGIEMAQVLRRKEEFERMRDTALAASNQAAATAATQNAQDLIANISKALSCNVSDTEYLSYQLREDPQVQFVYFLYEDLSFSS